MPCPESKNMQGWNGGLLSFYVQPRDGLELNFMYHVICRGFVHGTRKVSCAITISYACSWLVTPVLYILAGARHFV